MLHSKTGLPGKRNEPQDKLIGALIGLARATDGNEHLISTSSTAVIVKILLASADEHCSAGVLHDLLKQVETEKRNMVPNCFECASPCGRTSEFDMRALWIVDEETRNLKFQLLDAIIEIAACAHQAALQGRHDKTVDDFFYKALNVIGMDWFGTAELLPIIAEAKEIYKKSRALL